MLKRNVLKLFSVLSILLLVFSLIFNGNKVKAKSNNINYINSVEDFKNAIIHQDEYIYVDDISFKEGEILTINHSINIIGKNDKSVIKNLHIQITPSNTPSEKIKINLSNIVFDGCFDKSKYDLMKEVSFDELFDGVNTESFLSLDSNSYGYYDLYIDNCDIKNYINDWGAAINLLVNTALQDNRIISIKNTKVYSNVGLERIINIFDQNIILNIENLEVYDNYQISKPVNISNITMDIDGLSIHDNKYIPLDSALYYSEDNDRNLIRGGGLYLGNPRGNINNLSIKNNKTYYGGALFIAVSNIGDKKFYISNSEFIENEAIIGGGAVAIESYVGYPIYFTNCLFSSNMANIGSSLYATPHIWDRETGNTCLIEFSFCDFKLNDSTDSNSFKFYYDGFPKTQKDGKIILYGCRVEDQTFLVGNGEKENNYNIVGHNATEYRDIIIPSKEYNNWASGYYKNYNNSMSAGYNHNISNSKINPLHPIMYSVCLLLSIILLVVYIIKSTEKHKEVIYISIAIIITNIGYLLYSLSGNITEALIFNNIAYLGNAFIPLFFLIAVTNVCRYKIKNTNKIILSAISIINFCFTLTVHFSDLYYKNPSYGIVNGAVDIIKENGPLHLIYVIYVLAYFIIILSVVIYSLINKKLEHKKYAIYMFSSIATCFIVWVIELLISVNYEFLSVAFIVILTLMVLVYFKMEKEGALIIEEITRDYSVNKAPEGVQVIDGDMIKSLCDKFISKKTLTSREAEILALILKGLTPSDISETLFISKNTFKTHVQNIYKKLSVKSREELRYRVISELENK